MNGPDPLLRAIVGIYCALFLLPTIPLIVSWFLTQPREQNLPRARPYLSTLGWILRFVMVINIVLAFLMLIPESSFLGGVPNRLWGDYRLDGWSADVVWTCASTPFIIIASIPFMVVGGVTKTREPRFRRTAIFSLAWLACLPFYLGYVLLHMF